MPDSNVISLGSRRSGLAPKSKKSRREKSVDQSAEALRMLIRDVKESISDGFAIYDSENRLVTWNRKFGELMDYAQDLMSVGTHFQDLVRRAVKQPHVIRVLGEGGEEAWVRRSLDCQANNGTYERLAQDGRWYLVSRRRTERGYVAVVWTDITEKKLAEQAVRENEALYRELFDGSIQGLAISNARQVFCANQAFCSLFGLKDQRELRPVKVFDDLIDADDRKRVKLLRRNLLKAGSVAVEIEFKAKRTDDREIWVQAMARRIEWKGRPAVQLACWDITEKRQYQDELISKKLESVGAMARGIALEFQKVFVSILSYVHMAKIESYAMGLESISEMLSASENAGQQARDLIQQLLYLYRGGVPVMEHVEVESLLKEALPFSGQSGKVVPLQRKKVRFKLSLVDQLWKAYADRGQMLNVFRSLIIHGVQAMPDGGTLEISAENARIRDRTRGLALPRGRYVKVAVKDQGGGILRDDLTKLFDPYFAPLQNVGGFGLTSAYSIVKHHGGAVTVSSRVGKGTTLTVYLPAMIDIATRN